MKQMGDNTTLEKKFSSNAKAKQAGSEDIMAKQMDVSGKKTKRQYGDSDCNDIDESPQMRA